MQGQIFNEKWSIIKGIGKGSFSQIYLAKDITSSNESEYVAIKLHSPNFDNSMFVWESNVLKELKGSPLVPKYFHFGSQNGKSYLVMEVLTGEDASSIRNRARSQSSTGLIKIPIATYFIQKMLNCIQYMHSKGYIHRDIKPSNFVRRNNKSTEFCIIDFGLAKMYKEKDGSLRPPREKAEFRGTAVYASPFVHAGEDQCPRDDVYSILHIFLDFIAGELPWTKSAKSKDRSMTSEIKKQCYSDLSKFMDWFEERVKIVESNKNILEDDSNFSARVREHLMIILNYLKGLKYQDSINYDFIREHFQACIKNPSEHNPSDINYSFDGFAWSSGKDILNNTPKEKNKDPVPPTNKIPTNTQKIELSLLSGNRSSTDAISHKIYNLSTKLKAIINEQSTQDMNESFNGKEIKEDPTDSNVNSREVFKKDFSFAIRWKNLAKSLLTLLDQKSDGKVEEEGKECLKGFFSYMVQNQCFLDYPFDEKNFWGEFLDLQKICASLFEKHKDLFSQEDNKTTNENEGLDKKPKF